MNDKEKAELQKPGRYWTEDGAFYVVYNNLIFLIIMDSVGAEQFVKSNTPNMDNGGFKKYIPAYAGASWTTPSIVHMLTGRLPFYNGAEQVFPHVYWLPQHFHELGGSTHYLSADGAPRHITKYEWDTFHGFDCGFKDVESFVNKALDIIETFPNPKKFFYMHFEETHSPYIHKGYPNDNWRIKEILDWGGGKSEIEPEYFEWLKERQRKCIEYVDKVLKPLIDMPSTMIITSDHSDVFGWGDTEDGRLRYFGHDCTKFYDLLKVPLLVRV